MASNTVPSLTNRRARAERVIIQRGLIARNLVDPIRSRVDDLDRFISAYRVTQKIPLGEDVLQIRSGQTQRRQRLCLPGTARGRQPVLFTNGPQLTRSQRMQMRADRRNESPQRRLGPTLVAPRATRSLSPTTNNRFPFVICTFGAFPPNLRVRPSHYLIRGKRPVPRRMPLRRNLRKPRRETVRGSNPTRHAQTVTVSDDASGGSQHRKRDQPGPKGATV